MHNWITLLYTWNKHNILNQIYFNKIKKNSKYNFSTTQKSIINQETACSLESGFKSHLWFLTVSPQTVYWPFLELTFPICEMGVLAVPTTRSFWALNELEHVKCLEE